MQLRAALLPPDTAERHAVVARLVGEPATVLDVGGVPGRLRPFLPGCAVTTVNVEPPADVLFDGIALPFADRSFDVVTSLDVLEHLDRGRRRAHVEELVRVARQRVVACSPLGTEEHVASERELADWAEATLGRRHRFLDEHIEHGLPTEDELRGLVDGLPMRFELRFHGDFRRIDELFRLGVLARARRRPGDLWRYVRRRLAFRPDRALSPSPTRYTNRAFLVGSVGRFG